MKRAPGADDRRPRHEHRRQRHLLARQTRPLLGGLGRREIRSRRKTPTDWLPAIKQAAHLFLPPPLPAITADPDDEMFIECAAAAQAGYLVTGDKSHLLSLRQAASVPILL